MWAWTGARRPWGSFPHCPPGRTVTDSACLSGTFRSPQTNPAHSKTSGPQSRSPRVPLRCILSQSLQSRGSGGTQPKELLSWRHSRTALRSPKSACLSPVSATTLPPSLKWDTETRVRFFLNHHRCTPKGPQEADTSSAVPQAPTSPELHNGGNESLEVTPSNSGHSHFRAPLALCAYSGLWRPSQSLLSLSGSLSATWGTQA